MGHSNLTTTQGYLAITDQGLHDAVSKLGKKIKQGPGDVIRPSNLYQTDTEISLEPPLADPRKPFAEEVTVDSFTLELESASILIESLQVRTSEPQVPFRLMLFESDPRKIAADTEYEDLFKMEPVTQRLLNYPSGKALPYSNREGFQKLYGAICLYSRLLTIKFSDGDKGDGRIVQRRNQPVTFSITLRYQTS